MPTSPPEDSLAWMGKGGKNGSKGGGKGGKGCKWCGDPNHWGRDCKVKDAEMAARRAKGGFVKGKGGEKGQGCHGVIKTSGERVSRVSLQDGKDHGRVEAMQREVSI